MSSPVDVMEGGVARMLVTPGASGTGVMGDDWPIGMMPSGEAAHGDT